MEEIIKGKPFKSLAQMRRCDTLIAAKTITIETFQRDLAVTDVDVIPWRVGPLKPEDPDQAGQEQYRKVAQALKAAILKDISMRAMPDAELETIAMDELHPDQRAAQQEVYNRTTAGTGETV